MAINLVKGQTLRCGLDEDFSIETAIECGCLYKCNRQGSWRLSAQVRKQGAQNI